MFGNTQTRSGLKASMVALNLRIRAGTGFNPYQLQKRLFMNSIIYIVGLVVVVLVVLSFFGLR